IPWKLLSFNSTAQPGALGGEQQYSFTANLDQSKLASAPNFDKNQWPDMSRREWSQKFYSYYGITPESGTGGTGTGTEKEKGEKGGTGSSTEKSTDKGAGAGGLQPKSDLR